eukprot:3818255-Amphidinium_carterae.1
MQCKSLNRSRARVEPFICAAKSCACNTLARTASPLQAMVEGPPRKCPSTGSRFFKMARGRSVLLPLVAVLAIVGARLDFCNHHQSASFILSKLPKKVTKSLMGGQHQSSTNQ